MAMIITRYLITYFFFTHIVFVNTLDWRHCDQHITPVFDRGVFSHLNHPFNLSESLDCRIYIYIPQYLTIPKLCFKFTKFALKNSERCLDSYLEIPNLGRFCGKGWKNGVRIAKNSIFQPLCMDVSSFQTILNLYITDAISNVGFYSEFEVRHYAPQVSSCNPMEQAECRRGGCINKGKLCDGVIDCSDESDESTFHAGCPEKAIFKESCSFEWGLCGMNISENSWLRTHAAPLFDHTIDDTDGFILSSNTNDQSHPGVMTTPSFRIISNEINFCFSFWYRVNHLYYTFSIKLIKDLGEKKLLWTRNKFSRNEWNLAQIDLKLIDIQNFKIEFQVDAGMKNAVNLDDISLSPGSCYRGDISCTFEFGTCGWRSLINPKFVSWKIKEDLNRYSILRYLKISSDDLSQKTRGVMISRPLNVMPSRTSCLFFKLSVWGPGKAAMKINVSDQAGTESTVWTMDNEYRNGWHSIEVPIDFGTKHLAMIKFEAYNTTREYVEVAVDDLSLDFFACPRVKTGVYVTPWYRHNFFLTIFEVTTTKTSRNCPETMFLCHNSLHCIPQYQICDGMYDCHDFSDEENCSTLKPKYANSKSTQTKLVATLVPLLSIFVVFIAALLVGCKFFRKQKKRPNELPNETPISNELPSYELMLSQASHAPPSYKNVISTLSVSTSNPPPYNPNI